MDNFNPAQEPSFREIQDKLAAIGEADSGEEIAARGAMDEGPVYELGEAQEGVHAILEYMDAMVNWESHHGSRYMPSDTVDGLLDPIIERIQELNG